MEDYHDSKHVDGINRTPAASWSRMVACPVDWPGPLSCIGGDDPAKTADTIAITVDLYKGEVGGCI
mgnify:CR=1 FL=1